MSMSRTGPRDMHSMLNVYSDEELLFLITEFKNTILDSHTDMGFDGQVLLKATLQNFIKRYGIGFLIREGILVLQKLVDFLVSTAYVAAPGQVANPHAIINWIRSSVNLSSDKINRIVSVSLTMSASVHDLAAGKRSYRILVRKMERIDPLANPHIILQNLVDGSHSLYLAKILQDNDLADVQYYEAVFDEYVNRIKEEKIDYS